MFERFILLAHQLRVLNNFNGMNAILSGLGSSAVFRLQSTKEVVDKKVMNKYDKMQELMSSSQNFGNYKAALRSATPPAVPYLCEPKRKKKEKKKTKRQKPTPTISLFRFSLFFWVFCRGNYLSALVFIEEGNPDFVASATDANVKLINFKKRRLVSRVIEEVQKYQVGLRYSLIPVDAIRDFLANLPEENDDQLYELSLLHEPRKRA